jgi:hypothetical protein
MANRTAWVAGLGQGLTWGTLINSADMTAGPLATANTVLSSVADIANGSALDQFMDISVSLVISSNTIAAGANLAFWIYALNQDGTTYGDGILVAGTGAAVTPSFPPCAIIGLHAATSQTALLGFYQGIIIPPGSFRVAIQNNSGFTLTSGTQTVKYRTYNQNLNS